MPHVVIDRHQTTSRKLLLGLLTSLHGMIDVSDFSKDQTSSPRPRTGLDPISAVKMPVGLTATVDAWAEAHQISRSDAICRLVELGLKIAPATSTASARTAASDAARIEELAVHQIDSLLDPELSAEERARRIRRLTEGPPEFSHERIDLPKHQT